MMTTRGAFDGIRRRPNGAVGDVAGKGVVEQHSLLGHEPDLAAQRGEADVRLRVVGIVEVGHLVLDHAHAEAERVIDGPHPLRVAASEIVVDGDDVGAQAGQRVEVGGQRGHEGLALAGRHLGDLARVQHHAAHELHVEVAHAHGPARGLPAHRERLLEEVVHLGAVGEAFPELVGLGTQGRVSQRLQGGLERVDGVDGGAHALGIALVLRAEDRAEEATDHLACILHH